MQTGVVLARSMNFVALKFLHNEKKEAQVTIMFDVETLSDELQVEMRDFHKNVLKHFAHAPHKTHIAKITDCFQDFSRTDVLN